MRSTFRGRATRHCGQQDDRVALGDGRLIPVARANVLAFDVDVRVFELSVQAYFHIELRTGVRDLHSGIFGGAALNAVHALVSTLGAVIAKEGRLPEQLRQGIAPPSEEELAAWAELTPGADELEGQGARPMDPKAAEEFYLRTFAEPALDVNGIDGGSPVLQKTVLPIEAQANLSIRLAPGQDPDRIAA